MPETAVDTGQVIGRILGTHGMCQTWRLPALGSTPRRHLHRPLAVAESPRASAVAAMDRVAQPIAPRAVLGAVIALRAVVARHALVPLLPCAPSLPFPLWPDSPSWLCCRTAALAALSSVATLADPAGLADLAGLAASLAGRPPWLAGLPAASAGRLAHQPATLDGLDLAPDPDLAALLLPAIRCPGRPLPLPWPTLLRIRARCPARDSVFRLRVAGCWCADCGRRSACRPSFACRRSLACRQGCLP